jgi:hypothetical protein
MQQRHLYTTFCLHFKWSLVKCWRFWKETVKYFEVFLWAAPKWDFAALLVAIGTPNETKALLAFIVSPRKTLRRGNFGSRLWNALILMGPSGCRQPTLEFALITSSTVKFIRQETTHRMCPAFSQPSTQNPKSPRMLPGSIGLANVRSYQRVQSSHLQVSQCLSNCHQAKK